MTTTITAEQLELHAKWKRGEDDGVRLDVSGADLSGADLSDANLSGVKLSGANLSCAKLSGASLSGANLNWADLSGANLNSADLNWADLSRAGLRGADLSGALGLPVAADAPERLRAVATAALHDGALVMGAWHTCETTHCIAGWAIHQAGEPGRLLEATLGSQVAGLLLLGIEAHAHFYDSNEKATEYLRSVLEAAE